MENCQLYLDISYLGYSSFSISLISGWWEYDPRANDDLETAYLAGESKVELLIAGYVYLVDLHGMMQYRKSDPGRRRAVKRDKVGTACKGVAGIRPTVLQAVVRSR